MAKVKVEPGRPYQIFDKGKTSSHLAPRPNGDGYFPDDEVPIEPISIWRIYFSRAGRERAFKHFLKLGYLYFVFWDDVNGYALQASWRMRGQETGDPPYIIR